MKKRRSAFSLQRLAVVMFAYAGVLGIAFFLESAFASPCCLNRGWSVITVVALTIVAMAWLWPSFRLMASGLAVFWSAIMVFAGTPALRHGEWGIWEIVAGWSGVGFFVSLTWGALWTAIFRRSLPFQPNGVRCIQCGYDLRGLPYPRCPECGRANHGSSAGEASWRRPGASVNQVAHFGAGRLACIAFASASLWLLLSVIPGAVAMSDSHLSHSVTSCSLIALAIMIQIVLWPSYRLLVTSLMLNGVLPMAIVALLNAVFGLPQDVSSYNAWFRAEVIPLHATVLLATLVWGGHPDGCRSALAYWTLTAGFRGPDQPCRAPRRVAAKLVAFRAPPVRHRAVGP